MMLTTMLLKLFPNIVLSLGLVADDSRTKPNKYRIIIKLKNNMDKHTEIPPLSQTAVSGSVKASELRIGNLVYFSETVDIISDCIKIDFKGKWLIDHNDITKIKPIPLNKEWLNKFTYDFKDLGFPDLTVGYGITSEIVHIYIGNYAKRVDYVHELQNLYFALIGSELQLVE